MITAEKAVTELGVTELSLSNGVRVILKPTDFKNNQVVMNASRFGGQYPFDPKERFNAEFAATVVAQMGVGQFSPVDLRKVLAGKQQRSHHVSEPSLKASTVSAALLI